MRSAALYRLTMIFTLVGVLEILCLNGRIDKLTMQPPHKMAGDLVIMLASGKLNGAIAKTLTNAGVAFVLAMIVGVASAVILHKMKYLREVLDPLFATYYAVPVFAFYPLLIIIFGLGDFPQILIGFMLAVVAVIVNTMNGLDRIPRVLMKTARVHRLGQFESALSVALPSAAPFILTGAKLAVAYSLIGIIGAEFIMSRGEWGTKSASPTTTSTMPRCTR